MGVKLSEGLVASGLVGVNGIAHGALRHADDAGQVVAWVTEAHQIERMPCPLHTGKRMGIPLGLEYRHVFGGNRNPDPPRRRLETSTSPSSGSFSNRRMAIRSDPPL